MRRIAAVDVLVVPDCPHTSPAVEQANAALAELGVDVEVAVTVITSTEQATEVGFIGSPSFFIDGQDLFPVADSPPGLACRLYSNAEGQLSGLPETSALLGRLREVLERDPLRPSSASSERARPD